MAREKIIPKTHSDGLCATIDVKSLQSAAIVPKNVVVLIWNVVLQVSFQNTENSRYQNTPPNTGTKIGREGLPFLQWL